MPKNFLAPLKNIRLSDFNEDFFEIIPGIKISNSGEVKQQFMTEEFISAVGIIELNSVIRSDAFIFYSFDDDEPLFKGLDNLQILENLLLWVDDIVKNSWIVKDNCFTAETCYLLSDILGTANVEASSMNLRYSMTKSSGLIESTDFSIHEMRQLSAVHDSIEIYLSERDSSSYRFPLDKKVNRLGRALIFIKQAREARNIAYKVSNYCSALETVLTTDTTELSHRMSERAAFLLQDEMPKIDTFRTLKKAYGVRSRLTHGATLSQGQINELANVSESTDNILRKIITKVYKDDALRLIFDSSNSTIDDYFEKLIFR